MSGYLEGLVARSIGTRSQRAATARLRRGPRFPPPGVVAETRAAEPHGDSAPTPLSPPAARAPAQPRAHRSHGELREATRPGAADAPRIQLEVTPTQARRSAPRPDAKTMETARGPERLESQPPRRSPDMTGNQPRATLDTAPRLPRAELQIRPTRRGDQSPKNATRSIRPKAEPPIEVHIGRIEVTRPWPPSPAEPPGRKPAPQRRASRGFGELAASRRYVDRLSR
jgi:hypothetical protein